MSKVKHEILIIVCLFINLILSLVIPYQLGISNIVLIKTFSLVYGDITIESIIFIILTLFEYTIQKA